MKKVFRFNEQAFFVCLMTAVVAVLLYETFQLSRPKVAFFPKLIGIPLIIALVWQSAKVLFPRFGDYINKTSSGKEMSEQEKEEADVRKRRIVFIAWIF